MSDPIQEILDDVRKLPDDISDVGAKADNVLNTVTAFANTVATDFDNTGKRIDNGFTQLQNVPSDVKDVLNRIKSLPGTITDTMNSINTEVDTQTGMLSGKLAGLSGQLGTVASTVNNILSEAGTQFTSVLGTLGDMQDFFGTAGGVNPGVRFRTLLETFFAKCSNILENPATLLVNDAPFVASTLNSLSASLAKVSPSVIESVVKTLEDSQVSKELGDKIYAISERFINVLQTLLGRLMDSLVRAIGSVLDFPLSLQGGPLAAFDSVAQYIKWLRSMGLGDGVPTRAAVVNNSLRELMKITNPVVGLPLVDQVLAAVGDIIIRLVTGDPEAVFNDVFKDLVFPKDLFCSLIKAAAGGNIWKWADLPTGLHAGDLHRWINDPNHYPTGVDNSQEREYRLLMTGVADAYFREQLPMTGNLSSSLTVSDRQLAAGHLSSMVRVFVNSTLQFIFEPALPPLSDIELTDFEYVGEQFAALIARQTSASIRCSTSLLLRGIWVWSVENEVLIELIAEVLSGLSGAMTEGVLRGLTWNVKVYSRNTSLNDGLVEIAHVDSLDGAESPGAQPSVTYGVVLRATPPKAPDPLTDPIAGFLRDYAAYVDMCYHEYMRANRFGSPPNPDQITITEASVSNGQLSVKARAVPVDTPCQVLRAYALNRTFVMLPKDGPLGGKVFELSVPLQYVPSGGFDVVVLSSRGGVSPPQKASVGRPRNAPRSNAARTGGRRKRQKPH